MNKTLRAISIAARNVRIHTLSVVVLAIVLVCIVFFTFWAFGLGAMAVNLLPDIYRSSYGEMVFFTGYADRARLAEAVEPLRPGRFVVEREVTGYYESPKKSDTVTVVELTGGNRARLAPYIRPVAGRWPESADEILVPEIFLKGIFRVGDPLYVTVSTPRKTINTIRFRISGFCTSMAVKGSGTGFLVTEGGMDALLNTPGTGNLVYLSLGGPLPPRAEVERLKKEAGSFLAAAGIPVASSWTVYDQLDRTRIFIQVMSALRVIIMAVFFTLLGAVVAALVWMHSLKRRGEIWTYISLGLRNSRVILLMAMEYWIVACAAFAVGVGLGYLSSWLCVVNNVWLHFSYTLSAPLSARVGPADLCVIFLFTCASVSLWLLPPLRRIVRSRPYSF